jgi:molybdopterin biosynthesis enzyme
MFAVIIACNHCFITTVGSRIKLVLAMPGNPVSCLVTNHLFCAPAIKRLKGYAISDCMPAQAQVTVMQV